VTDDIKPQLPAIGGRPQAIIPTDLDSVYRLATAISKSGIAPKGMQTPEQIMVAILHGAEVGLPPMASVQRIAVIGGRATIWGDAALGLVMATPAYEDHEETVTGEGDSRTATCVVQRRGKKPKTGKFSVADAKIAHLWGKEGPWRSFPDRMLQMRARGFALRDAFPDVLGGLYLQEEMEGIDAIDVTPRASYGPPADPPPPEQALIEQADIGIAADMEVHPLEHHPLVKQRKPRATKAEMKARRAVEAAGKPPGYSAGDTIAVMDQIKEGVEANLPPLREIGCADSMLPEDDDIPMPPDEPPPMPEVPTHIQSAVAKWKTVIKNAESETELDSAWDTHLSAVQGQMPEWVYAECINLDDERRGEIG
jgi:hypothetical protein